VKFLERIGRKTDFSDCNGREMDKYDAMDPIYVMVCDENEIHLASMRLLPMGKPNMFFDQFSTLLPKNFSCDQEDLECTRLCISPRLDRETAELAGRYLMAASLNYGIRRGVKSGYGVFYRPMLRVYRKLGWEPEVVHEGVKSGSSLCIGKWLLEKEVLLKIRSDLNLT